MQHYWSLEEVHLERCWLSVGTFDGVHLGHQEIIHRLTQNAHAEGLPAVVVTFFPHPAVVLGKKEGRYYLSTPEERAEYLGELGVDIVITHPFNREISQISAHDFVAKMQQALHFSDLIIGYDFALGKDREGNAQRLLELGQEFHYNLEAVDPIQIGGQVVSSSLIRSLLAEGEIDKVNQLLGKPFQINGDIVIGDGRGRSLGIPTANLEIFAERAVPKEGVYVCHAGMDRHEYGAVVNIGVRPTFEVQPVAPRIEAHLLDFHEDVYGKSLRLSFIERLRDEIRFPSKEALIEQIKHDIQQSRNILLN